MKRPKLTTRLAHPLSQTHVEKGCKMCVTHLKKTLFLTCLFKSGAFQVGFHNSYDHLQSGFLANLQPIRLFIDVQVGLQVGISPGPTAVSRPPRRRRKAAPLTVAENYRHPAHNRNSEQERALVTTDN